MLTRLRIQGFKNLFDVDIRFGPFTCIAGKNGVGKSNIFDAIRFLSLLSQHPIMEAARKTRISEDFAFHPSSLFTSLGRFGTDEMRFTADILLDRDVEDDFGIKAQAAVSAVRYEVAFSLVSEDSVKRLQLRYERLTPRTNEQARRDLAFPASKQFKDTVIQGRRQRGTSFISMDDENSQYRKVTVHQEGRSGRKLEILAENTQRTVINGMASSEFPTILAVNREMAAWRFLMLEPSAMRAPSRLQDSRHLDSRGSHLAGAIYTLAQTAKDEASVYTRLANDLAALLDDVRSLRVSEDPKTETLTLEVSGRDGVFHPAKALSDGTLRFLVLATLAATPAARGMLCFEEPENGIHPGRIEAMVNLLRDYAVDPTLAVEDGNWLRQVIVNTHSPEIIKCIYEDDLILVGGASLQSEESVGQIACIYFWPGTWRETEESNLHDYISPGDIQEYFGIPPAGSQLWLEFMPAYSE